MAERQKREDAYFVDGPIVKKLIVFALPIFLGNVFQQLYNMVDSVIVGRFVGANALAAVGASATTSMILVGLMLGFPMGASIIASQFMGANRPDRIKATISTGLYFLLGLAAVITLFGFIFSRRILTWMNVPENIFEDSLMYFRIFIAGTVFMALYNFFASFLRALGDSRTPLIFLIISSVLNIFGDLFFVVNLKMGVAGVAIATDLAQMISVILCFLYTRKKISFFQFQKGEMVFDRALAKDIVRYGVPTSLQTMASGLGMLLVQSLINSFGSVNIASYTAAAKMEQVCNLPMSSFAMAISVFAGQNIGAKNYDRIKDGHKKTMGIVIGIALVMSSIIFFFGHNLMLLFVKAEEAEVVDIGRRFMRNWAPLVFLHGIANVNTAFLRGFGDTTWSMICSLSDMGGRMAFAFIFALGVGLGFMGISWAIPCGWALCLIVSSLRYYSGKWKTKAVDTDK